MSKRKYISSGPQASVTKLKIAADDQKVFDSVKQDCVDVGGQPDYKAFVVVVLM